MKKLVLLVLAFLLSNTLSAQKLELSDSELAERLDAVLAEGNLLYKYEKAAWAATDLVMEDRAVKKEYAGFVVCEDQTAIRVVVLGREAGDCIAEYVFTDDFDRPDSVKIGSRELSEREKSLIEVREKILKNLFEEEYEITVPDGYSPNFVLLPSGEKYKLYVIMGTSQRNIIPFGNDYLFVADREGQIEERQQFHSHVIPGYTKMGGNKVRKLMHSHLKTTPLITATDICTFKLYAPLYDIDSFSVYSTALGKGMEYNWKENKITVE